MKKFVVFLPIFAVIVLGVYLWFAFADGGGGDENVALGADKAEISALKKGKKGVDAKDGAKVDNDSSAVDDTVSDESSDTMGDAEREMTPEEKEDAEEEKAVDTFDALTDKWMEPSVKGVTMDEIKKFCDTFRNVPKARKDECIHRALNLVPDDNVMLLAGILLDKSFDKEIIEAVFNDVLNRDESVKKPIMKEIFKDKSHPCWADVAWILDVTGELPKSK